MNERPQQRFLWEWSHRRKMGQLGVLGLGAGIGAIGGVIFAAALIWLTVSGGDELRLVDDMAPFFAWLADLLGPVGFLSVLAIGAFGGIGAIGAFRVWGMQEAQYHALLQSGASAPTQKPPISWKDNAPKWILIGVTFVLLGALLVFAYYETSRGST